MLQECATNLSMIIFGVDIEKVWLTAQEDLPVLKQQVIGILKDFGK